MPRNVAGVLKLLPKIENLSAAWSRHGGELLIQKAGSGSVDASCLAGSLVSELFSADGSAVNGLGSWLLPGFDPADRQGLLPLHVRAKALPSLEECD